MANRPVSVPIEDTAAQLEAFVRDDYARLVVALGAIFGDRQAAEDAVADALTRATAAISDGTEIEALDRWVFSVARNIERNRTKRESRIARLEDRERESATPPTDLTSSQEIRNAVERLPDRQREVVLGHY